MYDRAGIDRRWIGIGRENRVLIPEFFVKSAAFLVEGKTNRRAIASGFLVLVPIRADGAGPIYVVTARHVLLGVTGPVFVRLNKIDGTYEDLPLPTPTKGWEFDEGNDIAVAWLEGFSRATHDIWPVHIDRIATDEQVSDFDYRPGDEVFFIGLFSEHPGWTRNLPIVRFGHVSLMPSSRETILVKYRLSEKTH